jgi:hypothetical protein
MVNDKHFNEIKINIFNLFLFRYLFIHYYYYDDDDDDDDDKLITNMQLKIIFLLYIYILGGKF